MRKNLLIVFVKNPQLGKVKTRLAKTIGDEKALEVYHELLAITEREIAKLNNIDVHIYYTQHVDNSLFIGAKYLIQAEGDLGQRMQDAFEKGFQNGYQNIVGIGADLPDIQASIIEEAFDNLKSSDTVFGPASDGGYYLLGMKKMHANIFTDKAWSTERLLNQTLSELSQSKTSYSTLVELNDIDTIEDLKNSSLNQKFK